jgi:hypothetical protein
MSDILCPLCGKPNPPELDECQYCQAPLKSGGFIPSSEGEEEGDRITPGAGEGSQPKIPGGESQSLSNLEDAVPDWLRDTEAGFLEPDEPSPEEPKPEEPVPDELSAQIASLINPPAKPAESADNGIDEEWLASLLAEAGAVESTPPEQPRDISCR